MNELKVAIIIPTLNEERTIEKVITSIPKKYQKNIIVADCQSTDKTAQIAKRLGATVITSLKRNYDQPCFLGSQKALASKADIFVYMHAGGDDDVHDLDLLIDPIQKSAADLVMGARVKGDPQNKALAKHQKIGTKVIVGIINLFFNRQLNDIGPFRAISANWYKELKMRPTGFSFPSQMLVKSLKKGGRVIEVPITSRPRIGKSKISGSLKKSLLAGRDMFWALRFII